MKSGKKAFHVYTHTPNTGSYNAMMWHNLTTTQMMCLRKSAFCDCIRINIENFPIGKYFARGITNSVALCPRTAVYVYYIFPPPELMLLRLIHAFAKRRPRSYNLGYSSPMHHAYPWMRCFSIIVFAWWISKSRLNKRPEKSVGKSSE